MGHLDRYKKPGGFTQLLELLESFAPSKQAKFMALVEQENATWGKALKERILSVERICGWPSATLAEVVPHIPVNLLGIFFHGMPKEKMEHFLAGLPASEKRKIVSEFEIAKPQPHEVNAVAQRLIETVRRLVKDQDLRLEAVDPLVMIDEKTESKLINSTNNVGKGDGDVQSLSDSMSSSMSSAAALSADTSDLVDQAVRENVPRMDAKSMQDAKNTQALVVSLQKENKSLKTEIKMLKDKLDAIRKIA